MGADFIRKAAPTFKKSWDRGRVALGTADLFTREPSCAARTTPAEILEGAKIQTGETLTVEKDATGLIVRRGLTDVARIANPREDLLKAVEASCGIGKGTVEQVP